MIKLFTDKEFNSAKSRDLLPLKCEKCGKTFHKAKHRIQDALSTKTKLFWKFCSKRCSDEHFETSIEVECCQCKRKTFKTPSEIKKVRRPFCSQSCAALYNNTHKTHGTSRSKLEKWLESKLITEYPELEFHFSRKDAINGELDIYIPSLKLAFELNGIFHYEPIYGKEQLIKMQNNDKRKFQACLENGIELCIIDTTSQKYFKENTSLKFLNIIRDIIERKMAGHVGEEPTSSRLECEAHT